MIIHLYYNIAKLLYSIITDRGRWFILLELIGAEIVIVTALILEITYLPNMTQDDLLGIKGILFSLSFGIIFFITGVISRHFTRTEKNKATIGGNFLPRREESFAVQGFNSDRGSNKGKNHNQTRTPIVSVGIIDFTWLAIMAVTYSGLLYVTNYDVICNPVLENKLIAYYELYYDEIKYLLQESLNIAFILGTILAGCMAIFWGGEIWRKARTPDDTNDYKLTSITSMKMVVAYLIIVLSELIWISIPLYKKMSLIKTLINVA